MNSDQETDIRNRYRALRAHVTPGDAITVLHIGPGHTAVATGRDMEAADALVLNIGAEKTAREFFRRSPPTPLEMENAIATVEDEVTRVLPLQETSATLWCTDAVVRRIAVLAGVTPGARMSLSLEAMEQTFERLAAVAEGRRIMDESLPDSTGFAAALLILREFMHHLRFAAITVTD